MPRTSATPIDPISDTAHDLCERALRALLRLDPWAAQPSGALSEVEHTDGRYINGDADGLWRAYDPDGKVTQLGCFRAGKQRWGVTGDKSTDDC
jgi:hypothetical protein